MRWGRPGLARGLGGGGEGGGRTTRASSRPPAAGRDLTDNKYYLILTDWLFKQRKYFLIEIFLFRLHESKQLSGVTKKPGDQDQEAVEPEMLVFKKNIKYWSISIIKGLQSK